MKDPMRWGPIGEPFALEKLKASLRTLVGHEVGYLKLPFEAALRFEPSQVGTVIGTLTDALLPYIALDLKIGLTKGQGIIGDREGYPDFIHEAGYRIELKGVFCDNPAVPLKKPSSPRESSARLTQKVTLKNVVADRDALLLLIYQMQPSQDDASLLVPVIKDLEVLPVIECVRARDYRLTSRGGRWVGEYETPVVLSKIGKTKLIKGMPLSLEYGRKSSEGKDYNEDTNFGKLKRIPLKELHAVLKKHGAKYVRAGTYPKPWTLVDVPINESVESFATKLEEEEDNTVE